MKIAKADLVPKDVNLRENYKSFGELEAACRAFCDEVNARTHRATRSKPAEKIAEERQRLHSLPREPFTATFGTTRRVTWESTISVEAVRYSVPHELIDTRVWARFHGDEYRRRDRRGRIGFVILNRPDFPAGGLLAGDQHSARPG